MPFAKAYLINLDARPDRLERSTRILGSAGVPFERFPGASYKAPLLSDLYNLWVDEPHVGYYGCLMSHLFVLRKARDEGLENVLIIEDDVVLSDDFAERAPAMLAELMALPSWDMFFFHGRGATPCSPGSAISRLDIPPWRTQMYAVNKGMIARLARTIETSRGEWWLYPIDAVYVSYVRGEIYCPLGPDMTSQFGDKP